MFIDQLEMIQEKTRGNLTNEETMVLRNALSNLQMAFVEVSGGARPEPARRGEGAPDTAAQPESPQSGPSQPAEQPASGAAEQKPAISSAEPETESRKKFTKSYGP
jgi:DNA replication initiation complex subunit (GINS family)